MGVPTPADLLAQLDRRVAGQLRAKRALTTAVHKHLVLARHAEATGQPYCAAGNHLVLVGPTGDGKSMLVTALLESLGYPTVTADASSLVEAGYKGEQVSGVLRDLLAAADDAPPLAERGIVFLDEVDKIRKESCGGTRDISGEGAQRSLLTALSGRRIGVDMGNGTRLSLDTRRILFIAAGAFVGLEEIIRRRLGGTEVFGFASRGAAAANIVCENDLLAQAVPEDFVEFGLIPEFIGRFGAIVPTEPLTETDLREILVKESSALVDLRTFFALHGVELCWDERTLSAIAHEAIKLGTGARALSVILNRSVAGVLHEVPELAARGIGCVEITEAVVQGHGQPRLRRARADQATEDETTRRAVRAQLEKLKCSVLDWETCIGPAREFWLAFEDQRKDQLELVLRVAQELAKRQPPATIAEFYKCYRLADTDHIQSVLHFLDHLRSKRASRRASRSAAHDPDDCGPF